jgi:AcrR family transcriptional regulator
MTTAGQHPPRPMRADARRNYERVLAEAKLAFMEHGPDASLEDIARRAGVGIGTLYRHFPTRLALQEAVYRNEIDELCAKAYELLEAEPEDGPLAAWMRVFAGSTSRRGMIQTLKVAIDRDSELFAHCHREIHEAAGAVLDRARQLGTVRQEVTTLDLLRLVHGVSVATERHPEDADRLLGFMIDGLRPQN